MTAPLELPAGSQIGAAPIGVRNAVLFLLAIVAAAAVLSAGFVAVAPNRLVSGRPVALWNAAGGGLTAAIAVLGAGLFAVSLMPVSRRSAAVASALAAALLLVSLAALGHAAHRLAGGVGPAARVSAAAGFWLVAGSAALALVDALQRLRAGPALLAASVLALAIAIAVLGFAGAFDDLSIAREYATHRALFAAALLRHIALVAGSVGPAIVIGFPLGALAARRPGLQGPLFAVLNLLQTIPSIALFGLLIAPLSALAAALPWLARIGVGGIGPAPAIIALVLYALLPIARNTAAGLAGVAPAIIDAARGMGLTPRQIFGRVELPLALPVLLAGLRIVTVQTIGLSVVAALIGAGGLGTFVFEGLGQYALDLVLLGAVPAIFLALAADFALRMIAALLHHQGPG